MIGVDLLGHGTAPKPHDPEAYADLTARIVEVLPDGPVDAVGFSLGAMTLLRARDRRAGAVPPPRAGRHRRQRASSATTRRRRASSPASKGDAARSDDDNVVRLFVQYAEQPGNDLVGLARRDEPAGTPADHAGRPRRASRARCSWSSATATSPSPADALVAAFPNARCVTLRNIDHFATPDSFGFIDAALEFLDAVPA